MADLITVASSALPPGTRTLAFRGAEAISTLYRFEIFLLVDDPAFDMDASLGAAASLSVQPEGAAPFVFHGVLASFESVDDLAGGTVYRAEIAPRLWHLSLTQHSRVFVDMTVPDILQSILKDGGFGADDFDLRLSGSYPQMPHVCQYKESDFAFLSRRMEREGIYFLFEQGEMKERLIVTDDRAYQAPFSDASVRYVRVGGLGAKGAVGLRTFKSRCTGVPGSVKVRDYDYLRPTLDLSAQASTSGQGGEIHLYGENALTPEDGARLARIRTQEHAAQSAIFRGAGGTMSLRSGYTFKLEDHPRLDGSYLVTELSHRCKNVSGLAELDDVLGEEYEGDYVYGVDVTAIAASVQFRPARRTPVPRIYGMEGAVVDGPANTDYAQLDEHGRYFVKMRIDEGAARDGKASARVRMMQPHGGNPESFHFPLRKGTEVLLAFEGGDPDRPVIAGVVPNLLNPSPVTAKNSTKNVLMTGGGNRLIIEDAEGKEYIHLATPHKRTFMHMGSTFNPQYNHITNTDGTNLSYTTQLSTTFVGDDNETIVDRARLTVIGRSAMTNGTPAGTEVGGLLNQTFLNNLEQEKITDAAETAAIAAANAWAAVPTDSTDPTFQSKLQAAITALQTATTDITAALNDANTWLQSNPTNSDAIAAQAQMAGAQNAAVTEELAAFVVLLSSGGAPSSSAIPGLAQGAASLATLMGELSGKFNTSAFPDSPHSNVNPKYITIERDTGVPDPLPAGTVPTPTQDTTAWDNPTSPGAPSVRQSNGLLNSGSDLKVVGGDNLTMVQFDSRSHTMGTSYGLVLGGQASVVRNGQQSRVFAPVNSAAGASLIAPDSMTAQATPGNFVSLSFPLPALASLSTDLQKTAQRSEVYGDTFSWVDGTTTLTVTGGTQTMIVASNRSRPQGTPLPSPALPPVTGAPWTPPVESQGPFGGMVVAPQPRTTPSPLNDGDIAQASEIFGDQVVFLDGNQTSKITKKKTTTVQGGQDTHITGGQHTWADTQTTNAGSQETHVNNSYKTATTSEDITWLFKFAMTVGQTISIQGGVLSLTAAKIDFTLFSLHNHPISMKTGMYEMKNGVLTLRNDAVTVFT